MVALQHHHLARVHLLQAPDAVEPLGVLPPVVDVIATQYQHHLGIGKVNQRKRLLEGPLLPVNIAHGIDDQCEAFLWLPYGPARYELV